MHGNAGQHRGELVCVLALLCPLQHTTLRVPTRGTSTVLYIHLSTGTTCSRVLVSDITGASFYHSMIGLTHWHGDPTVRGHCYY